MSDLAKIQQGMFGTTGEALDLLVAREGAGRLAMSFASDAQELIALGQGAEAERYINRVKYILDTHMTDREAVA